MVESSYEILHDIESDTKDVLIEYLQKLQANNMAGQVYMYYLNKEYEFVILSCVGNKSVDDIRMGASKALVLAFSKKIYDITISVDFMAKEVAIGSFLCFYRYNLLKTGERENLTISPHKESEEFEKGALIAYHQNFTRFLADTPANLMTPTDFVAYAKDFLKDLDVEIIVREKDYLEKMEMNLFLSVTAGSVQPPKMLEIKYKPNNGDKVDVALVGKGITFDSGGISLKPSKSMGEMKADMMGGAAVLSAIGLCAAMKVKKNVTATIPLCENLPSGSATKPGDVKIAKNKLSVEIDNTDAEGRLVLADALVHAKIEEPKYMIDVATLTGAIGVALGNIFIGCFCNDDAFAELIHKTAEETNNLTWRMPLSNKYKPFINSNVADIKNIGDSKAGSCTAAIFLAQFVDENVKWAHLDIAGVMIGLKGVLFEKGMSGKSTQLLYELIEKLE